MGIDEASKLFVAGLPDAMTEASLRDLFTNTGSEVQELTMPRDRATGRPRGFAFVRLASPEQAEAARGSLDGTLIEGRAISVRPFSSEPPARGERRPGMGPGAGPGGGGGGGLRPDTSDRTLYVGNLPYDVTEQEVRELFTQNGGKEPQRIHLPVDPEGRRRGFGFVTFESAEGANEAIIAVREGAVRGRRCVVNIAHPRGERPARPGGGPPSFERRSFDGGGGGGGGGPPGDMGGGRGAGPRKAFGADAVAGATRGDKDRRRRRFEEGAGGGASAGRGGGGKKKRGDDWGDDY